MGVAAWRRVLDGVSVTGKVGESLRVTEAWEVRCDSPLTSRKEVIGYVPCGWYSSHWEFTDCKAMEFNAAPIDRTGMVWRVTVVFYVPQATQKINESTGVPEDFWECAGGTTTIPLFRDKDDEMVVNAAGDPLEGLEKEREEESWTLTKYYTNDTWKTDRAGYAGRVNSDEWANGQSLEWKCYFKSARKREIQNVNLNATASSASSGTTGSAADVQKKVVVETVWEFRREPDKWKAMPWDVGFMEKVDGKRQVIKDEKGNAVKQPVALNANGTKREVGQPPIVIRDGQGAEIYKTAAFGDKFGDPYIIQATT